MRCLTLSILRTSTTESVLLSDPDASGMRTASLPKNEGACFLRLMVSPSRGRLPGTGWAPMETIRRLNAPRIDVMGTERLDFHVPCADRNCLFPWMK
jgi:hypothetical protein